MGLDDGNAQLVVEWQGHQPLTTRAYRNTVDLPTFKKSPCRVVTLDFLRSHGSVQQFDVRDLCRFAGSGLPDATKCQHLVSRV